LLAHGLRPGQQREANVLSVVERLFSFL